MKTRRENRTAQGFTLLELLVAMGIFLVISAAALGLFARQQPVFNRQQNMASLNIAVRNAISQLQLDAVNAGSGYYVGTGMPGWPIGITIKNNVATSACNTASTFTYGANCFDKLNIISVDSATAAGHPDGNKTLLASPPASDCVTTSSTTTMDLYPPGTPAATMTVATATAYATNFKNGDLLLILDSTNSKFTVIKLTADATVHTVSGRSGVALTFASTNSDGTNSTTNDPLDITTHLITGKLFNNFCVDDWVLRLNSINYTVDITTASNPMLMRSMNNASPQVLAEQVIGFKVGAAIWNSTDETVDYNYDASTYPTTPCTGSCTAAPYDWTLIRSVRVSMIARTTPVTDPTYTYRNGFDSGHYQVEGASVVVNPRNMTMNNN